VDGTGVTNILGGVGSFMGKDGWYFDGMGNMDE
jgi:hypothetical protein